jgi:4-amino-4-deoxy-L-arabinose transferase-like glycosyltransferase
MTKIRNTDLLIITGIFLLSFSARLYAFFNISVINPDGVIYINQAKAILNNDWKLAKDCGYDFISLYHLLIPFSYKIFGDWVIAAKSISFFWGSITVIPLYFILKKFFKTSTAFLASLAFSVNPFFVSYSVQLVKDPIFWFFALVGIYFFIASLKKENQTYFLLFSSLSFLIASLARFEILIYFIGSIIYISFFEDKKGKKILFFSLPIIFLGVIIISNMFVLRDQYYVWKLYFMPRVQHFFNDFFDALLKPDILVRSIIALKLEVYKVIKVLNPLLAPFFVIGILNIKKETKKDRHLWYFILIAFFSAIALFLFYIKVEILSPRYAAFIILPSYIFFCFGIENIMNSLKPRGFSERKAIGLLCFYILTSVVIFQSNFIPKKTDKIMYKEIGEYIAAIEKNKTSLIMASDARIMFYANLYADEIICGNQLIGYGDLIKMDYQGMVIFLKNNNIEYFLWDKKSWINADYDFLKTSEPKHFREIKHWDEGQWILYWVL